MNSDVEVEGEIEVDILFQIINLPHLCFSSTPPFEKVAAYIIRITTL